MGPIFLTLILVGAVLAVVGAVRALRAYLRYRRVRAELQNHLTVEVERLTRRTGELERGVTALQTRAAQLPITISELQHSLATLQVLTAALATSLGQAQKVLSYDLPDVFRNTGIGRVLRPRGQDAGRSS